MSAAAVPVLPIAEARRRLSELIRKVREGHPPIAIGRRGQIEVVIAAPGVTAKVPGGSLRGLVQIVGGEDALERAGAALRGEIEASLEETRALLVKDGARSRYASARGGRAGSGTKRRPKR